MKLDEEAKKALVMAMTQLTESYQLSPAEIYEIITAGLKAGFKKDLKGAEAEELKKADITANIGAEGEVIVLRRWKIVDEVTDPNTQQDLETARKAAGDDKLQIGDYVRSDITPESLTFSRIATITAAQTIKQSLKMIEKEKLQEKFKDKEGKLLKAKVIKITENNNILLEIEQNPIILPPEGQLPQRKYTEGEIIRVFLKKSCGTDMLPDISQTNKEYVEAVLNLQIEELKNGKIKIEKIARRAWIKTKVLLKSDDPRIDPVGIAVGTGGERVININEILSYELVWSEEGEQRYANEKVEFIGWTEDRDELIMKALKPATVEKVTYKKTADGEMAVAYVKDGEKALALWKKSANVQTASEIVGMKIEII